MVLLPSLSANCALHVAAANEAAVKLLFMYRYVLVSLLPVRVILVLFVTVVAASMPGLAGAVRSTVKLVLVAALILPAPSCALAVTVTRPSGRPETMTLQVVAVG